MSQRTFKGSVEYEVESRGLRFSEPVYFSVQHPSIEKLCLESQQADKIILKFHVVNEESVEKAIDVTNLFVDRVLNRIAFAFDAYVGKPQFVGGSIVEEIISEGGIKSITMHPSPLMFNVGMTADLEKVPPSDRVKDLLDGLRYEDDLRSRYFGEYRFVLLNSDPIAVFIALYNILLHILGDAQKNVDNFILANEPDIQVFPVRDRTKQTLYTKLRNDIGHAKHRPLKEINEEVKSVLDKFKIIVRKAIEHDL